MTAWAIVMAVIAAGVPVSAVSEAKQAEGTGRISGIAQDANKKPLANTIARLRNLDTGQLVMEATTNAAGEYAIMGLNAGRYAVEIVNSVGEIIGTTPAISLTAGAMVATGVTVTATAAAATVTAAAAAAAAGGGFFASTAGIITLAAAGAGAVGVVAKAVTASASQ